MASPRVHPQLIDALARTPHLDVTDAAALAAHQSQPRPHPGVTCQMHPYPGGYLRIHHSTTTANAAAAVLLFHGGGYLTGSPLSLDPLCGMLAARLGVPIIAASYRLAPQHHYPAQRDDAVAALHAACQAVGVESQRIIIGGQSAGAGLAARTTHHLAATGQPLPAAQWLWYPMLDPHTTATADYPVWTARDNEYAWKALLGPTSPAVMTAELSAHPSLPQTYLVVGDADLFYAEDRAYAQQLAAAGVPVELDIIPGGVHDCDNVAPQAPVVVAAMERAVAWLAGRLGQA